ncbi:carbon-nitrogen family hydrolase [Desulfoferrobacter suflitae]|uniref:carbon-nitrogen family hydrolase n=1 Tax=Desulfoferrobacter suflitae TaxID=2865782 RepID=UPI002164ECF5|nr:carbon-nitrogen family hydrolase [Desulfoferrobacter suflitae]MCK8600634.1 carbon-nitrogen family hydrolase [Desulfoferrobacter suflitae]
MQVASIQMSAVDEDKSKTIDKATGLIRSCRGSDLIVLPEIWNVGFMSFDRYIPEAESRDGPTLSALRELAAELKAYLHSGSFVEKDGDHYYNSSYLISPKGDLLGNYRKIHLFGYHSLEAQILTAGKRISVVATPLGRIGMATCYDLRFPEFFRRMIDLGAELFTVCSAWPQARLEHWLLLNRVRALENQSYLISANSVGFDQGILMAGRSMTVDPWGIAIASAGDHEVILKAQVDRARVDRARAQFPALQDRVDWLNPAAGACDETSPV